MTVPSRVAKSVYDFYFCGCYVIKVAQHCGDTSGLGYMLKAYSFFSYSLINGGVNILCYNIRLG